MEEQDLIHHINMSEMKPTVDDRYLAPRDADSVIVEHVQFRISNL